MSATWWNRSWTKRIKVRIDNSQQAETLTDFPLLVILNSSRVNYADIKSAGEDIRFVAEDNATALDYEIERFDASGTSVLWVRIPVVGRNDSKGYVWLYYGNAAATAGANPTGVWSASHLAVWHMKDDPSGSVLDSTTNANHLTTEGTMTSGDLVNAKIGKGIDLDGLDDALKQASLGDGATWTQFTMSTLIQTTLDAVEENATDIFASWRIDEGETLNTFDTVSGDRGGCHYTMAPGVSVSDGVLGKCLIYDGVDDITRIPASTVPATGDVSVGFWFNPTDTINATNAVLMDMYRYADDASTNDILVQIMGSTGNRGKIRFSMHRNASLGSYFRIFSNSATWTAGVWYHVVCTYSASVGMRMYVDGVLQTDTQTAFARGPIISTRAAIGAHTFSFIASPPGEIDFFKGKIDEVKLWSKTLSGAEVTNIYQFYLYHPDRVMLLNRGHDGDAFEVAMPHRGPVSCGFDRAGVTYLSDKFAWSRIGYNQPSKFFGNTGDWHLVHFVWDGSTVFLYVDGELKDSVIYSGALLGTGAGDAFYIGRSNSAGPTFLRGVVDETRVLNAQKSSAWVKAEYLSAFDKFLDFGVVHSENEYPEPSSPSPTYLSVVGSFAREPTILVRITLPGTITGSQTFYFSLKEGRPLSAQIGKIVRPYLLDFAGRTTKLSPDRSVTERSKISLTFAEDENPSDFDSTIFTVYQGGPFWRRFVVAQPDYIGSLIEVLRGFATDGFDENDFEVIFKGRIEEIGFSATKVTVSVKDAMTFVDRQVPAAISDTNLLNGAITSTTTAIVVDAGTEVTDPATLASKDLMPVTIRIHPMSIPVLASNLSWTAATHALTQRWSFLGYTFQKGDMVRLKYASITEDDYEIINKQNNDTIVLKESIYDSDIAPGIAILPKEDVNIASVSTNTLTVVANYISKSEDFTDAMWGTSTSTISPNVTPGPWGGRVGTLVTINDPAGGIVQQSGFDCDNANWCASVWLRATSSANIGTIHLYLWDHNFIHVGTVSCPLTESWQRFEVTKLLATSGVDVHVSISRVAGDVYGFYIWGVQLEKGRTTRHFYTPTNKGSTSPIPGAYAGRGLYGTSLASHDDNSKFIEVLNYSPPLDVAQGLHPIFIIRDLINRGGVAVADVDEATFSREFGFIEGTELRRAGTTSITDSQKLSELIEEVREQALVDLWVSEKGRFKVIFSFRTTLPGGNSYQFTDEENIVFRSVAVDNNRESRKTRVFVYYDPLQGEPGDEPSQFRKIQVVLDVTAEVNPGPATKAILSKWIYRSSEALALAGRIISRYKRAARIVKFDLDVKDDLNVNVGEFFYLYTSDILAKLSTAAVRSPVSFEATQKTDKRKDGKISIEALEARGLKYCVIGPNSLPSDYDDATPAQKQYCWIGTSANLVGTFGEDGYYIL